MKLLLHYLKFDFLRWRWMVLALWGLVLLHTAAFLAAELLEKPEDAYWQLSNKAHLWDEPKRVMDYITAWLAGAALVWAVMLTVLAGAADSPVRGRTWLLTRAGSRRVRVAARLTFVFLTIDLPLVLGYAAMPTMSGFDCGTVLLSFWLALKMLTLPVLALWLWLRAWPHPGGLVFGVCMTLSLWGVALFFEMHWPVEWDAIRPLWVVLLVCLTLPALVCLRAAGKQPRDAAVYAWGAGALLPLMLVVAKGVSHGLRAAIPGPLESRVFANAGEEWTLELTADSLPRKERYQSIGVPFPYLEWISSTDTLSPSIVEADILAASWQRAGTHEWSAWRPASGKLLPDKDKDGLSLSSFAFDRDGLTGEEHLAFRLKVRVSLLEKEDSGTTNAPEFSIRGPGWTYERKMRGTLMGPVVLERGRVAPGVGIDWLSVERTRESSSGFSALFKPVRGGLQSGLAFNNRHWETAWMGRTAADPPNIAAAPTRMIVFRREECVRTVRLTSVHMNFPEPQTKVESKPRDPQPSTVTPAAEPFAGRERTRVWPPRPSLTIPAVTADRHEVMYFIHWLKSQPSSAPSSDVAPLVQAFAPQFLEIAALDRLAKDSPLLQALTDGLAEKHRDALLALVPNAPWLVEVVEKRGWQAEAKPFVLEAVRRTGKIEPALVTLCRSYRDPAFHEWMRKDFDFKLDLPTVLYWESMPDLAGKLPGHLDQWSRNWRSIGEESHEILLQRGNMTYLLQLVRALNSRYDNPAAAQRLERIVLDDGGNPPPSAGLILKADGELDHWKTQKISPEFRRWFEGLTEKDFRFDPEKRRFVRKSPVPSPP